MNVNILIVDKDKDNKIKNMVDFNIILNLGFSESGVVNGVNHTLSPPDSYPFNAKTHDGRRGNKEVVKKLAPSQPSISESISMPSNTDATTFADHTTSAASTITTASAISAASTAPATSKPFTQPHSYNEPSTHLNYVCKNDCINCLNDTHLNCVHNIYSIQDISECLDFIKNNNISIVLIDSDFDMDTILSTIQSIKHYSLDIAIIVLDNFSNVSEELYLKAGISDFIYKPINKSILNLRIRNQVMMQTMMLRIRRESSKDFLTQLPNRKSFDSSFKSKLTQFKRLNGYYIALCIMDIDNFKYFNDKYGHGAGDKILRKIGYILIDSTKDYKCNVARWGGEEFTMLLIDKSIDSIHNLIESIRSKIENTPHFVGTEEVKITMSFGLTYTNDNTIRSITKKDLFESADNNLYKAKNSGKNIVVSNEFKNTEKK